MDVVTTAAWGAIGATFCIGIIGVSFTIITGFSGVQTTVATEFTFTVRRTSVSWVVIAIIASFSQVECSVATRNFEDDLWARGEGRNFNRDGS